MQGFVKIALIVLLATSTFVPTSAGFLPDRFAHRELVLDELLEHADMISSILYIVEAYHRAFQNLGTRVCDDDGLYLLPIPTSACPVLNMSHAGCSNAAAGEVCIGSCATTQDVNNCVDPLTRKSISIYLKSDMACKLGDEEVCRTGARWLYFIALTSSFASLVVLAPWELDAWSNEDGLSMFLKQCCGCFFVFAYLFVIAWTFLMSTARDAVAGILAVMCCSSCVCFCCNWATLTNNPASPPEVRRQVLLNAPFISLLAVCKMSPETAKDTMDRRAPRKWALRFVQDVPETCCAVLDIWWFGGSWQATLDVALSGLMILSHLLKPMFQLARDQRDWVTGIVDDIVDDGRGREQPPDEIGKSSADGS